MRFYFAERMHNAFRFISMRFALCSFAILTIIYMWYWIRVVAKGFAIYIQMCHCVSINRLKLLVGFFLRYVSIKKVEKSAFFKRLQIKLYDEEITIVWSRSVIYVCIWRSKNHSKYSIFICMICSILTLISIRIVYNMRYGSHYMNKIIIINLYSKEFDDRR